ncbi:MAG: putative membrane protein [Cenarchaeum symbiont of Oopsacas minuta]|nr:putative membrane protein [Cenarchaeum symbiont of Oopsacas minuta]
MTAHDNISVPDESWPNWIWYAIEFAIVFAVSMVIAWQISDAILYNVADAIGHGDALESWDGVTIMTSVFQDIPNDIQNKIIATSNWIFYAIFAGFFGIWYLGLRQIILKKKTFA